MTIPTQMSLRGFIATVPRLAFGCTGVARFYARVGVARHRREADGTFTKLDPSFHSMAMFGKKAEKAYNQFQVGDQLGGQVLERVGRLEGAADDVVVVVRGNSIGCSLGDVHAPEVRTW